MNNNNDDNKSNRIKTNQNITKQTEGKRPKKDLQKHLQIQRQTHLSTNREILLKPRTRKHHI